MMRSGRPKVVLSGAVGQRPQHGGHAWVFANWLLGLHQLGCDVTFLDRLSDDPVSAAAEVAWLTRFTTLAQVPHEWAALGQDGDTAGLPPTDVARRLEDADLVIDVMGYLGPSTFERCRGLVAFLDIDPGWPQMWRDLGLADVLDGYDRHITIGENVGRAGCAIPTCGLDWVTTKQPVVLDTWPAGIDEGDRITSVASWRGPFGPLEHAGRSYGLRVHEFRRFFALPQRVAAPFELALDIDDAEISDIDALVAHGWRRVDPIEAAGTPERYQRYLQGSMAELMIAKNLYVDTRSGWFSDRSACYLASGKPVVAQDTGLDGHLPTGEGLLTFSTLDEAVAAVQDVVANRTRHAKAARSIAEEQFASDKVLGRLLDLLGVG